ncbi:MAG: DUF4445 domain-containing protein [Anaerolineae bacterium]|nr:DUF4445 domain-containing protein [Anaerolineae bacterium]
MTIHVEFEPVGRRGDCPDGQSLLDCARQLGVDLVNLCGGAGTCGRCQVRVLSGNVSDLTPGERELLTAQQIADGFRLACRAIPLGDCKIDVPPESLTAPQRTQVEGQEIAINLDPPVRAYPLRLTPPSFQDNDLRADDARLHAALAAQQAIDGTCAIDIAALRDLSTLVRETGWQASAVLRDGGEVVALLAPSRHPLGLAFDLGTTKIAAYLVDLESGQTLASQGAMNPQIAYGEDLIARIAHAKRGPAQAAQLQSLVAAAFNQMTAAMCAGADASPIEIVEAVVVGNTAMHHLFLQLPAGQLAHTPYVATVAAALDVKARDVGLDIAPGAYVHLLPNIAGFVGADHVAMLLATGVAQAEDVVLALDIGTNTEVCLVNRGVMTSISCASGPAFEGAHIKHGMRAAPGAIERVRLADDRIEYQTIGGIDPVGLCGSGILDGLAELYRIGVLDTRGRMGDHPRVRANSDDDSREFVLVGEAERAGQPAITITQNDVRELQLAKGAMRAGVQILLRAQGLTETDIDRLIIAGAFGTYIDVSSAIAIGMLPDLPLERFSQVGNAAGMGAKLALLSRSQRAAAQEIARRTGYIELATEPHFMRTFAHAMYLGKGK